MSTGNFHNVNARHIFACELEDEFDYADLVSNIEAELEFINCTSYEDIHELRSYPSRVIGGLNRFKCYKTLTIEVNIYAIIRSGYYSGCNLDWGVHSYIDGEIIENDYNVDDMEDCIRYAYENSQLYISPSNCVRKALQVTKQFEKLKNKAVTDIERIFKRYSSEYKVMAKFSNGETIYSKVKPLNCGV